MIRTVPETTGEGIELYIRTYYSLLRSSGDVRIRSLEETHEGMKSSLHLGAETEAFDAGAFIYAALRLPDCIYEARRVVMGQSEEVFTRGGLRDIGAVEARRRAGPPAPHAVRRHGHDRGVRLERVGHRRPDPVPDRLPDRVEQAAPPAGRHAGRARPGRGQGPGVGSGAIRCDPRSGCPTKTWHGCRPRGAAKWDACWAAVARRLLDLRINSLASGFNDYRRAVEKWWEGLLASTSGDALLTPAHLLRLLQPAQPDQSAVGLRAGPSRRSWWPWRRTATRKAWRKSGSAC